MLSFYTKTCAFLSPATKERRLIVNLGLHLGTLMVRLILKSWKGCFSTISVKMFRLGISNAFTTKNFFRPRSSAHHFFQKTVKILKVAINKFSSFITKVRQWLVKKTAKNYNVWTFKTNQMRISILFSYFCFWCLGFFWGWEPWGLVVLGPGKWSFFGLDPQMLFNKWL